MRITGITLKEAREALSPEGCKKRARTMAPGEYDEIIVLVKEGAGYAVCRNYGPSGEGLKSLFAKLIKLDEKGHLMY